jgi:hypothetical protein
MPPEADARIERARLAAGDELKSLVHEAGEESLLALLASPNLEEPHVVVMLERLDLSATVLSAVAGEGRWTSSGGVRLRLARHPRTPKQFALAAVRQLFLFDLVRLSLLPSAPADIRRVGRRGHPDARAASSSWRKTYIRAPLRALRAPYSRRGTHRQSSCRSRRRFSRNHGC